MFVYLCLRSKYCSALKRIANKLFNAYFRDFVAQEIRLAGKSRRPHALTFGVCGRSSSSKEARMEYFPMDFAHLLIGETVLFFVLWRRSTIIQYSFNETIFMQIFMGIRPPTEIKFCFPLWVCFYISLAASTILGRERDNKSGNSVLVVTYTHSFLHASFPF